MENVEVCRIRFGMLLRKLLRERGIRQTSVSVLLGVTNSAVSQMLSGKIVPNAEQLNSILRLLKAEPAQVSELKLLVARVRMGGESFRSPFNEWFSSIRQQAGYTQSSLAHAAGIPLRQLRQLENNFAVEPTLEETRLLAPLLHVTPADFFAFSASSPDHVAESHVSYGEKTFIPQINGDGLSNFKFDQSIKAYARSHARQRVIRPSSVPDDAVQVRFTDGTRIGLPWTGTVSMLLIDRIADPATHRLALAFNAAGELRLFESVSVISWRELGNPNAPDLSLESSIPIISVTLLTEQPEV